MGYLDRIFENNNTELIYWYTNGPLYAKNFFNKDREFTIYYNMTHGVIENIILFKEKKRNGIYVRFNYK